MSEPTVDAALFQGMFVRALRPDDELKAQLCAVGFDLARIQVRYPVNVWRQALDVTRRRLFPDRPEESGYRALGELFAEGYFETIVGRVISVPLGFAGPEQIIQHIPRMWRAGRSEVKVEIKKEGAQRWRLHFHDRFALPGFAAGLVEAASRRTTWRKGVTAQIENRTESGFELVVRW